MTDPDFDSNPKTILTEQTQSAELSLSRNEFIRKVVTGATLAGGILTGPKIGDRFLVPKAYAHVSTSRTTCGSTASNDTTSDGKFDSGGVVTQVGGPNINTIICGASTTDHVGTAANVETNCTGIGFGVDATLSC